MVESNASLFYYQSQPITLRIDFCSIHTADMGERDDYADGDPVRGHSSPLMTVLLVVAIVVAVGLGVYLLMILWVSVFGGFPK
jgi:hypothetical protein